MSRLIFVAFAGIALSSCGGSDLLPTDTVQNQAAAIAIGQRVCSQGAQQGWAYTWHAKLVGNNWRVWSGPEYDGHHVMELKVAKSTGLATECFRYAG
jgi:hypothetical protein